MRLNGNTDQVINPLIGSINSYTGTWTNFGDSSSPKFQYDTCAFVSISSAVTTTQSFVIYHRNSWPDKGAISAWLWHYIGGIYTGECVMGIGNTYVIAVKTDSRLTTSNLSRLRISFLGNAIYTSNDIPRYENHHLYIIWDKNGIDVGEGKTWKVFIDKILIASGNDNIASALEANSLWESGWAQCIDAGSSAIAISMAFKYWDEVVSTTPDWIYNYEVNGGDAYRYAMHPIYGSANGYKPNFGTGNGVGCYYVPGN